MPAFHHRPSRPAQGLAAVLVCALVLTVGPLGLTSCRQRGGTVLPPVLRAGSGHDAVMAVGPFANLRTFGWLDASRAYGWGDVTGTDAVYFTLGPGGASRAVAFPVADQLAHAFPLPGGAGCAGVHYADFTAWVHPLEGKPFPLGEACGVLLSPSGTRLLTFSSLGKPLAYDTSTWTGTPQDEIWLADFPYAGCMVSWVTDDLIVVRDRAGQELSGRLKLVREPEGRLVAVIDGAGDILSPFPSPDGRWLAVLVIDRSAALTLSEGVFPLDAGREIRVYRVSDLAAGGGAAAVIPLGAPAAGLSLTGLVWSPDGTRLAYSEIAVTLPGPWPDVVAYGEAGRVFVATGPAFAPASIPIGSDGAWLPARFSPAGSRLFIEDVRTGRALIWEAAAGATVEVGFRAFCRQWLDESLILGSSREAASEGRPLLVEAATGKASDPGWPGYDWIASPDGKRVAIRVAVGAGEDLRPFGKVAAGDWLVIYQVAGEP